MSESPGLSELSVTEFIALSRIGYKPCGLVVGACFFAAGWQAPSSFVTGPVPALTTSMRIARRRAVEAMRAQALAHGAEGVVGVRLEIEHHAWRGGMQVVRFLAIGTAIRRDRKNEKFDEAPHLRVLTRSRHARDGALEVRELPFTSDLSAHDFAALLRSGYRPIALATGNAVYQLNAFSAVATFGSKELTDYTRAYADARETAMSHLIEDVHADFPPGSKHSPVGIVGVRVEERRHAETKNCVEFTATGTAVAPLDEYDPRRREGPLKIHLAALMND